jgi:hypothetical protein
MKIHLLVQKLLGEQKGSQNCVLLPRRPEKVETNWHDPCWSIDSVFYVFSSVLKTCACLAEHGDRY